MNALYYALLILAAYLIGSVPSSLWIGKIFYHLDIRHHGSGNAGAANTFRVLGWKAGVTVLILDAFKGWLAVHLATWAAIVPGPSEAFMTQQLILGTTAAVGHIFPLYARFKGGKGVATFLGVALAIAPWATLISIGAFILALFLFNYISLSSMIAGAMFPVTVWLILPSPWLSLRIFAILVALLLIWTHRSNIRRIMRGEESRASDLIKKKKKPREEQI